MLSNKRRAVDFESPEVAYKRRRHVPMAMGENACVVAAPHMREAKRKRCDEEGAALAVSEVARLRQELLRLREEAHAQLSQAELVNKNLQHACEEQQKELQRVHQENKLLKRSVLRFNERREGAEREAAVAKSVAEELSRRVEQLERANVTLCMQQRGSRCGQDGWDSAPSLF